MPPPKSSPPTPTEAGFDACDAPPGVTSNGLQAGEINHYAALVSPIAGHTMAAAAHGHGQLLAAGKLDGADHIVLANAAHDQGRVLIDHPVPDLASAVVVVVAWRDQCAME
jgi:hypothetical protein